MEVLEVQPLSVPSSPSKGPKRPQPPPLAARVRVAVRVRPAVETNNEDASPLLCISTQEDPEVETNGNVINFQLEKAQKSFRFDNIFSGEATQADVYNGALQPLLASLLHGFNVTVLAYGQTGSGKTYTIGSGNNDGLIPRFVRDLFNALRNEASIKTTAKVSFLEIYCDEIRDLLANEGERGRSNSQTPPRLTIREDDCDVWVEGLQQVKVASTEEALNLLTTGRQRQTIGAHALNDHSSRSHAVYTLELSRTFAKEIKRAKLTFVDLAGSERAKKTMLEGQGMKEGSHINIGLLALGNVINALGSRQRTCAIASGRSSSSTDDITPAVTAHVPYRSSKLTRLLCDALGGNSVTLFIACISPETSNGNETLCTLQYANRTRSIRNKAQQNGEEAVTEEIVDEEASVARNTISESEIYTLREQVAALKLQLEQAVAAAKAAKPHQPSIVKVIQRKPTASRSSVGNQATSKARRASKTRHRLRVASPELDTATRELNQREGGVKRKTKRKQKRFHMDFNGEYLTNQTELEVQVPNVPELPAHPRAEAVFCNEKDQATRDQISQTDNECVNALYDGNGASRHRAMSDRSTQYGPYCLQTERKTPVDYVLLSPSQIFREIHNQSQKAGAPWPRRCRLNTQHRKPRFDSPAFPALTTKCSKTTNVLQELLLRTQELVENNSSHLLGLKRKQGIDEQEGEQTALPFDTFVDRMAALYDHRSRQERFVHRLAQRFRHLASILGAADVDSQMNKLSKYALKHQQAALHQHLEAFERLVADKLWVRLQHREAAIENYAGIWNDKLVEVFLSDDQYKACTPWHEHREDHEFFKQHILPFILNGWISVTPSDLENEQLWLTL